MTVGPLLGLLLGVGLLLVWQSGDRRAVRAPRSRPTWQQRTAELLVQAGIEGVSPRQLLGASAGLGAVAFVLVLGTSQVPIIAVLFGVVKPRADSRTAGQPEAAARATAPAAVAGR